VAAAAKTVNLHGHRVSYRVAGEGPVLVLVHGITSTNRTWASVLPKLAERHTVIAPDLLGHGQSAKPRGDYSLGAHASGVRDLLAALGHDRATFVGHSLGGGIVMQLAYQFPEMCERMVLVSSGGLGTEVSMLLRAAALPGAELVMPLLFHNQLGNAGAAVAGFLERWQVRGAGDWKEMALGYASLSDADARRAFVNTVRTVIDVTGQKVIANDRLYLAADVPSLLVCGDRDPIIPAKHWRVALELMPGSELVIFEGAGHFPHLRDPERFTEVLESFLKRHRAAKLDQRTLRKRLRTGATT
jgi:pimeloyl-ACP methyl ester carboxylesterase